MNSFGKLNAAIYRNMQIILNEELKNINIKSGQYDFFYVISKNEGITQSDLTSHLKISKATTAKAVKDLIKNDYIYKSKNKSDGRVEHLYLTTKGKEIVPTIYNIFKKNINTATDGLKEKEIEITIYSMERILNNLLKEKDSFKNKTL